jgi:hypothetical protein
LLLENEIEKLPEELVQRLPKNTESKKRKQTSIEAISALTQANPFSPSISLKNPPNKSKTKPSDRITSGTISHSSKGQIITSPDSQLQTTSTSTTYSNTFKNKINWVVLSCLRADVTGGDILAFFGGLSVGSLENCFACVNNNDSRALQSTNQIEFVDVYVMFDTVAGAQLSLLRNGEPFQISNASRKDGSKAKSRQHVSVTVSSVSLSESYWARNCGIALREDYSVRECFDLLRNSMNKICDINCESFLLISPKSMCEKWKDFSNYLNHVLRDNIMHSYQYLLHDNSQSYYEPFMEFSENFLCDYSCVSSCLSWFNTSNDIDLYTGN